MILSKNELLQTFRKHKDNLTTQLGYFVLRGTLFPLTLPSWREVDKGHLINVGIIFKYISL